MKLLQKSFGVTLIGTSLLVLVLSFLFAVSQIQKTDLFQLGHLKRAVKHVRDREKITGDIPTSKEFEEWKRKMDAVVPYSFEGYGYTLKEQCGVFSSDFCIEFWTGEDWVTYYSWQPSMKFVKLNSPRILYSIMLFAVGMAGVFFGKRMLVKHV